MRREIRAFCFVFLTAVAVGCEHAGGAGALTAPAPVNRIQEDPAYRLSEAERAALLPYFDADALERLLQLLPTWERPDVLRSFSKPVGGKSGGLLVKLGHPRLDALLEEVWAPFWDTSTVEEMDGYPAIFPGRKTAKRRRAQGNQP